jgi:DNA-binding NtrC family response regulator
LIEHLKQLPWHGNLKQLRTAIEHADLVCPSNAVGIQDLPCELLNDGPARLSSIRPGSVPVPPTEREAAQQNLDFKGRVREYEIRMIVDGLKHTGGNQRAAARLLRIPLRTLAHKIKAYRIKHRLATEVARERGVSA